jgi:EAL domain-containing protein (putative c-di-GMP-specific phosphodiesterase class I)/GGDEF domain-containing protein
MFGLLMIATTANLIFDIVTAYSVEYQFAMPFWINWATNTIFFIIQNALPVVALWYIMAQAGTFKKINRKALTILTLPGFLTVFTLVFVNPFTGIFFDMDPILGYQHGGLFNIQLFVCGFYMLLMLVYITKHRSDLRKAQYWTIFTFVLLVMSALVIQVYYPPLLIHGVALALGVTIMYFTLQNPKDMKDVMTDVLNCRAMLIYLKEIISSGRIFSMILVDVHDMKNINKTFGLNFSNQILTDVGASLSCASDEIWVFHMSDTKFAAITCNMSAYDQQRESIVGRFDKPWVIGKTEIRLSMTICYMADIDSCKYDVDEIVNIMEIAISDGDKFEGTSKILTVDNVMLKKIKRKMCVETHFQKALECNEYFEMYYQPIYSLKEKKFVGCEALLRFNHPYLGLLMPAEFIPIAEKNSLTLKMDESVAKMVCDFILKYDPKNTLGLEYICINLSSAEFLSNVMPESLTSVLDKFKADPGFIIFEITETVANNSHYNVNECMKEYLKKEYRFALDDFGTGYANISQVVSLPFNMVKIDHSLLMGNKVILDNVLNMFSQLDLVTVIEGVETDEHIKMLNNVKVDLLQGFYYARPMPVREFVEFLKKHNNK